MNMFKQIGAVTLMNLKSLPQRVGTSLVIIIGIAGVVGVLVSVLAMSTGMIKTLRNSGHDDRAVVVRNGAANETSSVVTRDAARLILDAPGVKRDAEGKPIGSAEGMRLLTLFSKDGTEVNVILRGVGPQVRKLRPEIKIVAGRMFQPALNEVIVGKSAQKQYRNMAIGDRVKTAHASWTIVGVFSSEGDSHESEVLADAEMVLAEGRGTFRSVTVLLDSPAAFGKFKDALTSNPALAVDVARERDYYAERSKTISQVISIIAYVIGGIMAVGAIFGALNTMYSAVSTRLREIATLRAIGFGATAMVISVLAEALLLAAIGGAVGALLAWALFNGNVVSTGGAALGQLIFELTVSPQLMVVGIVWAAVIGLIGGLFPAVRAARLPVATALRAV